MAGFCARREPVAEIPAVRARLAGPRELSISVRAAGAGVYDAAMDDAAYAWTEDAELARRARVSLEAVQLLRSCEVVDLHLETFIPHRLYGYDMNARHGTGPTGGRFFGHLDFPRALDGGLTGGMWSITTNIARPSHGRFAALQVNVDALRACIDASRGRLRAVRTHAEYMAAREAGAHAALLVIQGGNAYEGAPNGPASLAGGWISRVTLVHLTNSHYGTTSSPVKSLGTLDGLTSAGKELVEQLNAERIFVDLAHIDRPGFWDALSVHDRTQPALVTHTGVSGVKDMWRNLDDAQIRAIAETGGVVGVMFETTFLRSRGGPRDGRMVIDHLAHIVERVGEDHAAIGSDYDGFITPPRDLRDGMLGYARLVQYMLDRGWTDSRIVKILGKNFLRTLRALRPE
jgi:membrane dipeptidase